LVCVASGLLIILIRPAIRFTELRSSTLAGHGHHGHSHGGEDHGHASGDAASDRQAEERSGTPPSLDDELEGTPSNVGSCNGWKQRGFVIVAFSISSVFEYSHGDRVVHSVVDSGSSAHGHSHGGRRRRVCSSGLASLVIWVSVLTCSRCIASVDHSESQRVRRVPSPAGRCSGFCSRNHQRTCHRVFVRAESGAGGPDLQVRCACNSCMLAELLAYLFDLGCVPASSSQR